MIEQFIPNRTGVFIDGSNLLWGMKKKDRDGNKVNYDVSFGKLKEFLHTQHSPVFYNYYACEDNISTQEPFLSRALKQKRFFRRLESFGYRVVRKDLKVLKNGEAKCDTDVEIVMDLHRYADDLDTIVLFSGDSDFKSAVESFCAQGKRIYIYAFRSFLSWELKEFAIRNPGCGFVLLDNLKDKIGLIR